MSDRQDLKGPGCFLTIDQDVGKVFEQKSAGVEVRLRPAVRVSRICPKALSTAAEKRKAASGLRRKYQSKAAS